MITHHGPHARSVHPNYAGNPLNPAFNSDLSALLPMADLLIHGHVHDSFDYVEGGCRVVANPRGYPLMKAVRPGKPPEFENPAFLAACVVEV